MNKTTEDQETQNHTSPSHRSIRPPRRKNAGALRAPAKSRTITHSTQSVYPGRRGGDTGALRGAGGVAHYRRALHSAAVHRRLPRRLRVAAASTEDNIHIIQQTEGYKQKKYNLRVFSRPERHARHSSYRGVAPCEHARQSQVNRKNDKWERVGERREQLVKNKKNAFRR